MSWAGVTVALLPVELAHDAAAALTALVSASPDDPIRIFRSAFPVVCGAALLLKPLPQAAVSSTTVVATSAARRRLSGRTISGLLGGITVDGDGHPQRMIRLGSSRTWRGVEPGPLSSRAVSSCTHSAAASPKGCRMLDSPAA